MPKGDPPVIRETKKPKKDKPKVIAANPTMKGIMQTETAKLRKK